MKIEPNLTFDAMADYVLDRYGVSDEAKEACKRIEWSLGWEAEKLMDAVRNRKPVTQKG